MVSEINSFKTFWKAQNFKKGNIYKNLRMQSSRLGLNKNIKIFNPDNYYSNLLKIKSNQSLKNKNLANSKISSLFSSSIKSYDSSTKNYKSIKN